MFMWSRNNISSSIFFNTCLFSSLLRFAFVGAPKSTFGFDLSDSGAQQTVFRLVPILLVRVTTSEPEPVTMSKEAKEDDGPLTSLSLSLLGEDVAVLVSPSSASAVTTKAFEEVGIGVVNLSGEFLSFFQKRKFVFKCCFFAFKKQNLYLNVVFEVGIGVVNLSCECCLHLIFVFSGFDSMRSSSSWVDLAAYFAVENTPSLPSVVLLLSLPSWDLHLHGFDTLRSSSSCDQRCCCCVFGISCVVFLGEESGGGSYLMFMEFLVEEW